MHHHKFYGRRLCYGGAFQAGTASTNPSVSLFNDSTIGHILRVRGYLAGTRGAGQGVQANLVLGTVGTLFEAGLVAFTGEQQHAGSIYTSTNQAVSIFGNYVALQQNGPAVMPPWPLFYLRPGWSLNIFGDVINTPIFVTFWWEDLEPNMLDDEEWL